MPPVRKDPPGADDLSRPSTSRAFCPSDIVVPPVKRARTSTSGGAPSATRRQSTGGGRQARMEEFIDEKELQERLLVAVVQTADEIMKEDEEEGLEKIEIEKEVISATAGIVWDALAEDWATDLVAFSRHAGRETIREDDVKLLMRRNPLVLAEILGEGEEEGDASTIMGTAKRKSTGGVPFGRPRKATRDEIELIDEITTPRGTSSTSIVPETPQGIIPLAHSTPLVGRSVSMSMKRSNASSFSIPSPIREEEEDEGREREGRRINRSIMDDLSATMREGNETGMVIDLRHPREQEEEERRMRREDEMGGLDHSLMALSPANQHPGPSTIPPGYGRSESPELFGNDEEEKKENDHDSFDDEIVFEDKENEGGGKFEDASSRMSESAALREMLDEEKETTVIGREKKEDSFDDDSIQFVEEKKEEKKATPPPPLGVFPSTYAATATVQQRMGAVPAAAAAVSSSSQDSFYRDEILDDPSQSAIIPPSAAAATVLQASPAAQPVQADGHDSFDDDDDDFVAAPSRSKENTPKSIGGPATKTTVKMEEVVTPIAQENSRDSFDDDDDFVAAPSRSKENTPKAIGGPATRPVANRWSTVEIEEVVSPVAQKNTGGIRGTFGSFFDANNPPGPAKPIPVYRPTVPSRPSPSTTVPLKPSPTVPISSSVHLNPPSDPSGVKQAPATKNVKAPRADSAGFCFFGDESSSGKTPIVKREDSDFMETSSRQTPPATRGFRGRGRGRGFPRKVDPNSRINRMIREQNTPVRLPIRPPSRISEVVGSFEDEDFDVSKYDD